MPSYVITAPDGKKYKVSGPGTKEEALAQVKARQGQPTVGTQFAKEASAITQGMNQPKAETNPYAVEDAKARYLQQMDGFKGGRGEALTQGSQAGLLGGFDDEIAAGMLAPIDAGIDMVKGQGFDMARAYERKQKMLDLQKAQRREAYPGSSIAGEVAGGLALGGTVRAAPAVGAALPAAGAVPTLAGRVPAILAAPVEGAAYGAVYGAGEAKPGERLAGAGKGALTGAALGTLLHGAGSLISRAGRRAPPPAATADELAAQSHALYDAADQANVMIRPQSFDRVVQNARAAAGNINANLRPNTAGVLDDIAALQGQPISLRRLDELRQEIALAMRRAQPQDVRTLQRMQDVVDNFTDNAHAGDITGNVQGFDFLHDARVLWARQAKTRVIDNILDMSDVDTGQYTQSGMANTIRKRMKTLYAAIQSGRQRGFTAEETALVREMARTGSSSQTMRLLARFAPRGVVSTLASGAVGGPPLLLAGHLAGRAVDRNAVNAAHVIRDAASRGYVHQPQLPNLATMPLIPGAAAASTGIDQSLGMRR